MRQCGDLFIIFSAAHDKPHMKVSLLIKPATYPSGVACLSLQPFPILHSLGPDSDFTQGTPQVSNQQSLSQQGNGKEGSMGERGIHGGLRSWGKSRTWGKSHQMRVDCQVNTGMSPECQPF